MNTEIEVLEKCNLEGLIMTLPDYQLDRKLYQKFSKLMEGIGGKWDKKTGGIKFELDPSIDIERLLNGEKINLKNDIQFFPTPPELALQLAWKAIMYISHIKPETKILEPSAGRGSFIKAIHEINPDVIIDYCEIDNLNKRYLSKLPNINHIADDFLTIDRKEYYDYIIANPPFSNPINSDIDHIYKMWECLKPGGTLATISSSHWCLSSNKKEKDFKQFLEDNEAMVNSLDHGAFKQSGTMIQGQFILIQKSYTKPVSNGQLGLFQS